LKSNLNFFEFNKPHSFPVAEALAAWFDIYS
jgi:hypothetical protein